MQVQSSPNLDYQTQQRANSITRKVDSTAAYLADRYIHDSNQTGEVQDKTYSTGCGRGFYSETHDVKWKMKFDPSTRKPTALDYDHLHEEGMMHRERLQLQSKPDGSKIYQRHTYYDGGGQIVSESETVRVSPQGTPEYKLQKHGNVRFENWLRRNPSLMMLGGIATGLATGGVLGSVVAGPLGGAAAGLMMGAMTSSFIEDYQMLNHRSNPDPLEYKIWRPVDHLETAVKVGGIGCALALGAAVVARIAL